MAPEGSGKRRVEQPRGALKKGPWTTEEDAVLSEYVRKHGEGNWNAVQRNSGLMRCGKSCRLRWANHLRPNLKKGAFSPEEEAIIVDLHSKLGNKWARMAAQLPGRTDNEIKNYWNTRLKRRQRACMPIYDTKKPETQNHQQPLPTNPPPSSLVSLLASAKQARNPSHKANMSLYDIFDSSSNMTSLPPQFPNNAYTCNPNQNFKFLHQNNGGISSLGLSCKAQYGVAFNNQSRLMALSPISPFQYNSFNFGSDSTPVSGLSFEQNGVASRTAMDVPSVTPLVPSTTPTSSANATSDYNVYTGLSDPDEHTNLGFSRANSGLLGDLLGQAEALKEKINDNSSEGNKTKEDFLWDYKLVDDAARCPINQSFLPYAEENFVDQKHSHESSPSHSSVGTKATVGSSMEANNPVDDDFLGLLDNFPLTEATPDWCEKDGPMAAAKPQSCSSIDAKMLKENHPNLLSPGIITTPTQVFMGYAVPNPWNNMPGANQI